MKIAVIQASSQKEKNSLFISCVKNAAATQGHEIINFGIFEHEVVNFSYVQTAFCISLLLESKAIDFAVTGCSSGQGMMLACNSLPGVLCGYISNPSDAFLFSQINNGNAISYPLGLNFGWAAEINLKSTLHALFSEPFGRGYPQQDAARKQADTQIMKNLNKITKRTLLDILPRIDKTFLQSVLEREYVYNYIIENGQNKELKAMLIKYKLNRYCLNQ